MTPAPLTLQAADASRAVGDPNPTFTGTITGMKNNDAITASLLESCGCQTSPAGTYPIIPSAGPNPALGNYQINLINGTLTVS